MNSYMFRQWCRPRGDFRIKEMIEFLDLMKEAFRFPVLYDKNSRPVPVIDEVLEKIFRKQIDKLFPGIGVIADFFSIPPCNRDYNTVRFEIHTGTNAEERFIDTYDIAIGAASKLPDFDAFRKSIKIFKPFEAYIEESNNECILDSFRRQQMTAFRKPAIIRGFHFLDESMARSIGGIRRCLKAPAWRVERFCEGVLIDLVPGLFDSSDPEDLQVQQDVMAFFGLL